MKTNPDEEPDSSSSLIIENFSKFTKKGLLRSIGVLLSSITLGVVSSIK